MQKRLGLFPAISDWWYWNSIWPSQQFRLHMLLLSCFMFVSIWSWGVYIWPTGLMGSCENSNLSKNLLNYLMLHIAPCYVAWTRQHWNGHNTRTCDKFFQIHMTRVSDTFQTWHGFMIGVSVLHRRLIFVFDFSYIIELIKDHISANKGIILL